MINLGKKIGWKFIDVNKKMFTNTPIQKWQVTSYVYSKLLYAMYDKKDVRATYKNIELILPSQDSSIVPAIVGGAYESFEVDLFILLAKHSQEILDVGGNIGLYSVVAAKTNSTSHVTAFEPIKENLDYFRKNISLNGLKNIELVGSAVGASSGELEIHISNVSIGHHSAAQKSGQNGKTIKVEMVSVDDFVKSKNKKPDLIKVDVEGYDFAVFEGAKETMSKLSPTFFAEYAPGMMKQCGHEPKKFLNHLFKYSDNIYLIDEKSEKLKKVTKAELLLKKDSYLCNLLGVSNKAHTKILNGFVD